MNSTLFAPPANPIMAAELAHQQRALPRHQGRGLRLVFVFTLAASVALVALMPALPQIAALLKEPLFYVQDMHSSLLSTMVALMSALVFIQHLTFISQAVQQGSGTIAREKQARTWESLLLTGVSARQIIVGKWWATIKLLWRTHRVSLLLRAAAVLWLSTPNADGVSFSLDNPSPSSVMLAVVIAVLYPVLNMGAAAALGVLASLFGRQEATSFRVANGLQFVLIVLSLGLCWLPFVLGIRGEWAQMLPLVFLVPLEGGVVTIFAILVGDQDLARPDYLLFAISLCVLLFAAVTWGLLRAAQSVAVYQNALPR